MSSFKQYGSGISSDAASRELGGDPTRLGYFEGMAVDPKVKHLRTFFQELPFGVNELMVIRNTMEHDPSSPIYSYAAEQIIAAMESRETESGTRFKVSVRGHLTQSQSNEVAMSRPHLDIEFHNTDMMSHSMAHAQRALDLAEQLRMIPKGSSVLEIGGNLVANILRGYENWCTTAPLLDMRDGIRATAARSFASRLGRNLLKLRPKARAAWEKYAANPDRYYRTCRAEDVTDVKADWIFAQHSLYDVGLTNLVKIIHNCGAKGAIGSIIMNESTLFDDSGDCKAVGGYFRRSDNGENIEFGFNGDPSFMYIHKFSEYKRYYHSTCIQYEGCTYSYHPYDRSADTIKYVCMKLSEGVSYKPLPQDIYRYTGRAEWLRVKGPVVDGDKRLSDSRRVSNVEYFVPKDTVLATIERLKLEGGSWELTKLIAYLRSQDVRFVNNNICVKAKDKIPHEVFQHLATLLHVLVEYEVAIERRSVRDIAESMIKRREGGAEMRLFDAALAGIKSLVASPFNALVERLRSKALSKFKVWESIPVIEECSGIERYFIDRVLNVGVQKKLDEKVVVVEPIDVPFDVDGRREMLELALEDETLSDDDREELKGFLSLLPEKVVKVTSDVDSGVGDVGSDDDVVPGICDSEDSPADTTPDYSDISIPDFMDGIDYDRQRVGAIKEFVDIQKTLDASVIEECLFFWAATSVNKVPVDGASLARYKPTERMVQISNEDLQHNYLRVIAGEVVSSARPGVGGPGDYNCVIDPKLKMKVCIVKRKNRFFAQVADGNYYVNGNLKIFNSRELANFAARQILDPTLLISTKIKLVDGVPGCGKTYYVRELLEDFRQRGNESFVVLIAAKKSCEHTKLRLVEGLKDDDPWRKVIDNRVRTVDSYCLNPSLCDPELLIVDEARMVHAGQLYALISHMRPASVETLGDPQQVPYVNFTSIPMSKSVLVGDSVDSKNHSYRLSVRGAACALHMYDGLLRVKGTKDKGKPFEGKISVNLISSVNEIPKSSERDVIYICFYQWEKKEMIKAGFCPGHNSSREHVCKVFTVVEAQGSDCGKAVIVSLEPRAKTGTIRSQVKRVNSVLTRSWNVIDCYTMCITDMVSVWLRTLQTDENIKRVQGYYDTVENGVITYNALLKYTKPDFVLLSQAAGIRSVDYT